MTWWQRLRDRIRGGRVAELDPLDPGLRVVVIGEDDAEACSAVFARSPRFEIEAQVLLRHHLRLPEGEVDTAISVAAQDGYSAGDRSEAAGATEGAGPARCVVLILQRVQVLDALHCSQERSRMAGLAQRLGGRVIRWDALQPRDDGPA